MAIKVPSRCWKWVVRLCHLLGSMLWRLRIEVMLSRRREVPESIRLRLQAPDTAVPNLLPHRGTTSLTWMLVRCWVHCVSCLRVARKARVEAEQ